MMNSSVLKTFYLFLGVLSVKIYAADVVNITPSTSTAKLGVNSYSNRVQNQDYSLSLGAEHNKTFMLGKNGQISDRLYIDSANRYNLGFDFGYGKLISFSLGAKLFEEKVSKRVSEIFKKKVENYERSRMGVHSVYLSSALNLYENDYFGTSLRANVVVPTGDDSMMYYTKPTKTSVGASLESAIKFNRYANFDINIGYQNHGNDAFGPYWSLTDQRHLQGLVSLFVGNYTTLLIGYENKSLSIKSEDKEAVDFGKTNRYVSSKWLAGIQFNILNKSTQLELYGGGKTSKNSQIGQPNSVFGIKLSYRNGNDTKSDWDSTRKSRQSETKPRPVKKLVRKKAKKPRKETIIVAPKEAPKKIVKPDPRALSDAEDMIATEKELARLTQKRLLEKKRREQLEEIERQKELQAYLNEIENANSERFEEIENMPDVSDEEYFWEGLE